MRHFCPKSSDNWSPKKDITFMYGFPKLPMKHISGSKNQLSNFNWVSYDTNRLMNSKSIDKIDFKHNLRRDGESKGSYPFSECTYPEIWF